MANHYGAPIGKTLFLLMVVLALAGCAADTPESTSQTYRLDLGPGMVVAFVEGLTPEMPEKVAYVTHVPSGAQAILAREGEVIQRHDGRGDGPVRLEALLDDDAAMARIIEGLTNGKDARPKPHTITWVPLVQFDGTRYTKRWGLPSHVTREGYRNLTEENLGPELYRVAFRGSGYVGPFYDVQDGDSTHLNPGTPVHAVKGYSPEFRLGTLEQDGTPGLYEADTSPSAKTGGDLLDIRGEVTAIDILNDDIDQTVLATIDEERIIGKFVEELLAAPVNQSSRDHDGPRYFLGIRLVDGTAVVRAYWLESGELSRGIMTDPVATLSVWQALPDEHRPAATDGGPRISERLAARLGLAYLSFSAPELAVTGKPHSPTVRLMRRHEFMAMQGGSPGAIIPNQMVWVVQAQGSWRSAGIVPAEARRDFSVGLTAFDADTGETYGRSHRNEPLLEGDRTPRTS